MIAYLIFFYRPIYTTAHSKDYLFLNMNGVPILTNVWRRLTSFVSTTQVINRPISSTHIKKGIVTHIYSDDKVTDKEKEDLSVLMCHRKGYDN